jgi:hypothetical protein
VKIVSGWLLATVFFLSAFRVGSGAPASVTERQSVAQNLAEQQRTDGAILYTSTRVDPYFANIAAIGALRGGEDRQNTLRWMQWYVARSKDPNPWAIPGAITDYDVRADGTLHTSGEADSVDSYAATFISLAATAWREGDAPLRAYVAASRADIERIASAIDAVSDNDGLTWALPAYRLKYLMDNSEVYRGLVDLATLRLQAFGDPAGAARASSHALRVQAAIKTRYWDVKRGLFALALDETGAKVWPKPGDWMEDGTSQLFPILHGVIDPTSREAQIAYRRFTEAFPSWPLLDKPDPFPWASVAFVALQMNDVDRASAYASAVQKRYAPGFAYPWYCAESGWYLRVLLGLEVRQSVADL